MNNYEGYVQFDNTAKGTHVTKKVKELLRKIDEFPDKKQRLFVLRQTQSDDPFISFKESKAERLQKVVWSSNNYCLDKYLIEREKVMKDNKNGPSVGNIFNFGDIVIIGDQNVQKINKDPSTEEITNLIQAVLTAAKDLSPEEQEEVKEYTDVIQCEATAEKPKKSMIKTSLEGLKRIVTSDKFIDAVTKLSPVVMSFVQGKS